MIRRAIPQTPQYETVTVTAQWRLLPLTPQYELVNANAEITSEGIEFVAGGYWEFVATGYVEFVA